MNKDSVQYKVILLAVMSAICGLLLGAVNSITAPVYRFEAHLATVMKSSLEQIYPGADFAEVVDFTDDSGYITTVYTAEGEGTMYSIHGVGYNSDGFDFLYGINDDGTTSGFVVLSENETDGFGKRASRIRALPTILRFQSVMIFRWFSVQLLLPLQSAMESLLPGTMECIKVRCEQ